MNVFSLSRWLSLWCWFYLIVTVLSYHVCFMCVIVMGLAYHVSFGLSCFVVQSTAIWNEHKFIADRLTERWKVYAESRPKMQANWDRDAKRAPPPPSEPKPKPKPKPKKTKIKDSAKVPNPDDEFPVIEFKTPPVTPPPPPPEKIPTQEYKRDDDFWAFYDQETPK